MGANQPGAAWSGPGDPFVVVAGHLVSPQDGFGEIGRMANGDLRRPGRINIGGSGLVGRFGDGTGSATIELDGTAGNVRQISFQSGGVDRWIVRVDNVVESGADAGSDLNLVRRNDAGGNLGNAVSWRRSDGRMTQNSNIILSPDNTHDIGASGANRPRDLFLARDLTMGGDALIGSTTPATGDPRLDVVGENSFDLPTMVGAQRTDDLADKWFALAVRHDAIAEEPFIMIAGLSSGIASTVMYGGGTAPVAGSVNAATRHEWYTAADNTTIRGTLAASLVGVGAASLFHTLGNLRIGALSGTNVSVGVNDSGGAGFKLLRVPN